MGREDIDLFCGRHLPERDVVVYELVSEAYSPPPDGKGDPWYHDPPKGWRMGVRYLAPPPQSYGLAAVTPNTGSDYVAEHRSRTGARRHFTESCDKPRRTLLGAIQDAAAAVDRRLADADSDRYGLKAFLEQDRRLFAALKQQTDLRLRAQGIALRLPLLKELRESGRLLSVVLIGSLCSRDFVPGLSDMDLWVLARGLKPGLKVENVSARGLDLEVNLVCRNPGFLSRMLRARNPVDLVALRYGEALFGRGAMRALGRKTRSLRASEKTRAAWMTSSARWLSRAVEQYLNPSCAHCFFGALYHASRDLLRAHIVGAGGDLTEGFEVEEAAQARWPDLAERFGRIRCARANWETYKFVEFESRLGIEGPLGGLLTDLEEIARPIYRVYGLKLPRFATLLREYVAARKARGFSVFIVDPDRQEILVGYRTPRDKLRLSKRRIKKTPKRRGYFMRASAAAQSMFPKNALM
ncbi:MAG: hypothetical protein HY897_23290 [Deltaproteobacteria bacterium]|nr:hypothetical protein [Deltaproteobacteria bacterium]